MSTEAMKGRLEFLRKYIENKGKEILTLKGSLSEVQLQIERAKYEMEWASKEAEELSKSIAQLEST